MMNLKYIVSKKLLIGLVVNVTVLMALAGFFPNYLSFTHWKYGLLAGILLGLINYYLKPFISLMVLPFNIMTFGIMSLIINGLILELISYLLRPNFKISSLFMAIITTIIINLVNNYYNGNFKLKFIRIHHKNDHK